MAIVAPFSISGGLAGLACGLEAGWPAVEQRANHVLDLVATAPRKRTEPAVFFVQLLAVATVLRDNTPEPIPTPLLALLLRALSVVLGVQKHATRLTVIGSGLSNAEAAKRLGVSERTVRRWRADGLGPPSARGALELADRYAKGGRFRDGVAEALYDIAAAEVGSGTYFSPPLLWALAEVLEVARRDSGLTRGAIEVLHGGLRDPEAFIAAGLAEGRLELERPERTASINEVAAEAGVTRDTVRRWKRGDSPHAEAYALNKLAAAVWAKRNAPK